MTTNSASNFMFHSVGIVAANKPLDSDEIEVVLLERFPMLDGEVTDHQTPYKINFQDASNKKFNLELNTMLSTKATWLPISNSNRKTSPDVRRGEIVMVYCFGDANDLWWNTLKNNSVLRRLETVRYVFSNNRKENVQDDANSTYSLEVSTHKKLINVHTSKNDGEPFAYDIQINAKDGFVVITDDVGNYIELNSTDDRIRLNNIIGSSITIEKEVATIKAIKTIIDSPETEIKGNVIIRGGMSSDGNVTSGGSIMDSGGNSNHHEHNN